MDDRERTLGQDQGAEIEASIPRAISLDEVEDIANEVRDLLCAGDQHSA